MSLATRLENSWLKYLAACSFVQNTCRLSNIEIIPYFSFHSIHLNLETGGSALCNVKKTGARRHSQTKENKDCPGRMSVWTTPSIPTCSIFRSIEYSALALIK